MSRIKKIKEIRKSPLFLIVGLFLCLWCFTLRVNAAEPTIYQVDQMTDEDTIINGDSVITGKGTSGKHSFYVEEKVKTTITLRNLDVHLDSALLEIGERADVTLILEGENNLQRDVGSIITLQKHSSLTIKGGGSLNVKTKTDSQDVGGAVPAIGGRDGFNHITIESGSISVVVEAVSRSEYDTTYHHPGVAIGRGNHATEGKIYINGGTIYAQTQGDAAIGGSGSGSAEDIIISGGDITAIGGMETAAIGFGTYNAGQRSSYTLRLDPQKVAKMRVAGRAEEEVNFENTQKELTISGSRRSKFRLKDGEFDRVSIFDYQKGLQVVSGGAYTYENGVLTLNGSGSYNVKMADQTRYTSDRIVVNNASELTLTDVQMEAFKGNSNLTFNKDATLILEGTNRLRSEDGSAVFTDHNLSVKGSGKLEAGVRLENKPLEEQSGIFGGSGTVSLNCKEVSLDDTISFGDDSDDSEDLDDLEDLEDLEYLKKKILLSGFKMWDTRGAYLKKNGIVKVIDGVFQAEGIRYNHLVVSPESGRIASVLVENEETDIVRSGKEKTYESEDEEGTSISRSIDISFSDSKTVTVREGTGTEEYRTGDVVPIHAEPTKGNQYFSHWQLISGDGKLMNASSGDASYVVGETDAVLAPVYDDYQKWRDFKILSDHPENISIIDEKFGTYTLKLGPGNHHIASATGEQIISAIQIDGDATVVLDDLDMRTLINWSRYPIEVLGGDVTILLKGTVKLGTESQNDLLIRKPDSNQGSLTIGSASGPGALEGTLIGNNESDYASTSDSDARIGGAYGQNTGDPNTRDVNTTNIRITGGTYKLNSGTGALIGGSRGGNGSNIRIEGGLFEVNNSVGGPVIGDGLEAASNEDKEDNVISGGRFILNAADRKYKNVILFNHTLVAADDSRGVVATLESGEDEAKKTETTYYAPGEKLDLKPDTSTYIGYRAEITFEKFYRAELTDGTIAGKTELSRPEGVTEKIIADVPDGYVFGTWSLEGGGSIADETSAETTFTYSAENARISHTIVQIPEAPAQDQIKVDYQAETFAAQSAGLEYAWTESGESWLPMEEGQPISLAGHIPGILYFRVAATENTPSGYIAQMNFMRPNTPGEKKITLTSNGGFQIDDPSEDEEYAVGTEEQWSQASSYPGPYQELLKDEALKVYRRVKATDHSFCSKSGMQLAGTVRILRNLSVNSELQDKNINASDLMMEVRINDGTWGTWSTEFPMAIQRRDTPVQLDIRIRDVDAAEWIKNDQVLYITVKTEKNPAGEILRMNDSSSRNDYFRCNVYRFNYSLPVDVTGEIQIEVGAEPLQVDSYQTGVRLKRGQKDFKAFQSENENAESFQDAIRQKYDPIVTVNYKNNSVRHDVISAEWVDDSFERSPDGVDPARAKLQYTDLSGTTKTDNVNIPILSVEKTEYYYYYYSRGQYTETKDIYATYYLPFKAEGYTQEELLQLLPQKARLRLYEKASDSDRDYSAVEMAKMIGDWTKEDGKTSAAGIGSQKETVQLTRKIERPFWMTDKIFNRDKVRDRVYLKVRFLDPADDLKTEWVRKQDSYTYGDLDDSNIFRDRMGLILKLFYRENDQPYTNAEIGYFLQEENGEPYESNDLPISSVSKIKAGSYKVHANYYFINDKKDYSRSGYVDTQLVIQPKELTLAPMEKVYDGTEQFNIDNVQLEGIEGRSAGNGRYIYDQVSLDPETTQLHLADASVGEQKLIINQSGLTGKDAANYKLGIPDDQTVTVTPATIKITGNGTATVTKPYDSTADSGQFEGALEIAGVVGEDDVQVKCTPEAYEDAEIGEGKHVQLKLELTGKDAGNYQLDADTYQLDCAKIIGERLDITGVSAETDYVFDGTPKAGYTGTPVTEKYEGDYVVTYRGDGSTEYASSSETPTNAGDYIVTIAIPKDAGQYSGSLELKFTIKPLPVILKWMDTALTYSGTEQEIKAEVDNAIDGNPVLVTSYEGNRASDVGYGYTAKAASVDNSNYTLEGAQNTTQSWRIVPAKLQEVQVTQKEKLNYTGEPLKASLDLQAKTVDGSEASFTYAENEDGVYQEELPTYTECGTYTVYFKASAEGHESVTGSFEITISPKELSGELSISGTPIYGNTLTASYTELEGTVSYRWLRDGAPIDGAMTTSYTLGREDVGHRIAVQVTGDGNYAGQKTAEASDLTGKKPLQISAAQLSDSKIYDATADANQLILATGQLNGVLEEDRNSVFVDVTATFSDAAAGTDKDVTVSYALRDGWDVYYQAPEAETHTAAITPREVILTWNAPKNLVFDGTQKQPQAQVTGLLGSDEASVSIELVAADGLKDGVVVGDFRYQATAIDNPNYKLPKAVESPIYTVTGASIEGIHVEQTGTLTYSGEPQQAEVVTQADTVAEEPVVFTYSTDENGTYSESVPSFVSAGTHTVFFKVNAPEHEEQTGSFVVAIEQMELQEDFFTVADQSYNGNEIIPDVQCMDPAMTAADYQIQPGEALLHATADAEVTVVATEGGNYKGSITKHFAITPKELRVTQLERTEDEHGVAAIQFDGLVSGTQLVNGVDYDCTNLSINPETKAVTGEILLLDTPKARDYKMAEDALDAAVVKGKIYRKEPVSDDTEQIETVIPEESFDTILDDADKENIENGTDYAIYLQKRLVTDPSGEGAEMIRKKAGAVNDIRFYDLKLLLEKIGSNEPPREIANTGAKIVVTMELPEAFTEVPQGVERSYQVLAFHAGDAEAEEISSHYEKESGTISFQTDRFSLYAVSYTDVKTETENPGGTSTPEAGNTPDSTHGDKNAEAVHGKGAKTGDTNYAGWFFICMILSAGLCVGIVTKKRNR